MVIWKAKVQGKALAELFEQGLADPHAKSPDEIDKCWKLHKDFEDINPVRFRDDCRKSAANCIGGKGLQGIRRADFDAEAAATAAESPTKESMETEADATTEDIVNEVMTRTANAAANSTPPKKSPPPAPTQKRGKCKANEEEWHPRFRTHAHPAKNHWREQIIIEVPGSFTGKKGTCEAGIEGDNQFFFKIPPNDVFDDPHTLHAHQATKCGRNFGDDSAEAHAMRDATKNSRKNWSAFRLNLQHKCIKSDDMGKVPWIDFAKITNEKGRLTPVLIVELKSIEPIEKDDDDLDGELTAHTFTAPAKVSGANFTQGSTALDALLLEEMIRRGLFADFKKDGSNDERNEMDPSSDMPVDGEESEDGRSPKNQRT